MMNAYQLAMLAVKPKEDFAITNTSDLSWALGRLRSITAEQRQINADFDIELRRIEELRKNTLEGLKTDETHYTLLIQDYMESLAAHGNTKTIKTPHGTVGWRKQQPETLYPDTEALGLSLERMGRDDLFRRPYQINKIALKENIKDGTFKVTDFGYVADENGEIIEGLLIKQRDPKVNITPAKG